MRDLISTGIDAVKEAGIFLKNNFGKAAKIEYKGDRNLATNLDKEAERMILDKIKTKFPHHGIIGEEFGNSDIDKEFIWIIDPLDGTHNYIRKMPVFGVSIGIVQKGRFIAGFIYMPIEDELYVGEKANGAYKNSQKISVSSKKDLKECSLSFDSSIRLSPDIMSQVLRDLSKEVFNVRMFGSSVRVLTYVAEGVLDASVEFHDMPWDFAGGVCIIEEAGGKITNLKGAEISYEKTGYVASNSLMHEDIMKIVSKYV